MAYEVWLMRHFCCFQSELHQHNFIIALASNAKSFAIAILFFFSFSPSWRCFWTDWQKLFVYFSSIAALGACDQDRT